MNRAEVQHDPLPTPQSEKPHFRVNYLPLGIDFLARWALLGLLRLDLLPGWLFWLGQVAVIPLPLLAWVNNHDEQIRARHGLKDINETNPDFSLFSWLVIGALMVHGCYQTIALVQVEPSWLNLATRIGLCAIFLFYMLALSLFGIEIPGEEDEGGAGTDETVDENDRMIIRLETGVADLQQRIESYTIESTLIGAIAFSAFVTIVASDKQVLGGVQTFATDLGQLLEGLVELRVGDIGKLLADLKSENTLLAVVAVLTLVCSMFFLSVVIARHRFNSVLAPAHYAIRLASSFNAKEEDLHSRLLGKAEAGDRGLEKRLELMTETIEQSVLQAQTASARLMPIVRYMGVFRNLGVMTFLAALIVSALWVSEALAALFCATCVLTYAYPTVDKWIRDRAHPRISFLNVQPILARLSRRKSATKPA